MQEGPPLWAGGVLWLQKKNNGYVQSLVTQQVGRGGSLPARRTHHSEGEGTLKIFDNQYGAGLTD